MGFTPVSVHTTFQFGDTPEFTWGKRNRLREKQLWLVDDDSYYQRRGPGPDPNEVSYSGYLQLTGTLVELDAPVVRAESAESIKIEGDASYAQRMHATVGDIFKLDEGNPNKRIHAEGSNPWANPGLATWRQRRGGRDVAAATWRQPHALRLAPSGSLLLARHSSPDLTTPLLEPPCGRPAARLLPAPPCDERCRTRPRAQA